MTLELVTWNDINPGDQVWFQDAILTVRDENNRTFSPPVTPTDQVPRVIKETHDPA